MSRFCRVPWTLGYKWTMREHLRTWGISRQVTPDSWQIRSLMPQRLRILDISSLQEVALGFQFFFSSHHHSSCFMKRVLRLSTSYVPRQNSGLSTEPRCWINVCLWHLHNSASSHQRVIHFHCYSTELPLHVWSPLLSPFHSWDLIVIISNTKLEQVLSSWVMVRVTRQRCSLLTPWHGLIDGECREFSPLPNRP